MTEILAVFMGEIIPYLRHFFRRGISAPSDAASQGILLGIKRCQARCRFCRRPGQGVDVGGPHAAIVDFSGAFAGQPLAKTVHGDGVKARHLLLGCCIRSGGCE